MIARAGFVYACSCVHYVSDDSERVYITHMLTIMRQFPKRRGVGREPVGGTESVFELALHKSTISGYGSDSNNGKHVGKS